MKSINMLLLLPLLLPLVVLGQQSQLPYFLTFTNSEYDLRYNCVTEFQRVRNKIFASYINDLLTTTNFTRSMANNIDPNWSNKTSTSNSGSGSSNRILQSYCEPFCNDGRTIIIAKKCCNYCGITGSGCRRRQLFDAIDEVMDTNPAKALRGNTVRKLSDDYDVKPVRNSTSGYIIVKASGGCDSVTSRQGERIAELFYDTAKDMFDSSNPCRDILRDSHYKVMAMTVVTI
jgi:hypothetical protein